MRQLQGCPWSLASCSLAVILSASSALAQTPAPTPASPQPASGDVRPATTTFMGDTGLWNVPTAEILPARKWSLSAYRVNFDDNQGFTDVRSEEHTSELQSLAYL